MDSNPSPDPCCRQRRRATGAAKEHTMTTQDTRALIGRLQARLGEGTPIVGEWQTEPNLNGQYTHQVWGEHPNGYRVWVILKTSDVNHALCMNVAAALNELPGQIARWLARLDECCDMLTARDGLANLRGSTRLADLAEDVQAWAVRLGVG